MREELHGVLAAILIGSAALMGSAVAQQTFDDDPELAHDPMGLYADERATEPPMPPSAAELNPTQNRNPEIPEADLDRRRIEIPRAGSVRSIPCPSIGDPIADSSRRDTSELLAPGC